MNFRIPLIVLRAFQLIISAVLIESFSQDIKGINRYHLNNQKAKVIIFMAFSAMSVLYTLTNLFFLIRKNMNHLKLAPIFDIAYLVVFLVGIIVLRKSQIIPYCIPGFDKKLCSHFGSGFGLSAANTIVYAITAITSFFAFRAEKKVTSRSVVFDQEQPQAAGENVVETKPNAKSWFPNIPLLAKHK